MTFIQQFCRLAWAVPLARTRHQASLCFYRRGHATWIRPQGRDTGIVVYNSLTRRKDRLIVDPSRPMSWYMCGPTVYDSAHLGHASTYVKFDIIRRLLTRYFNLPVVQVMGLTDIDDKIVARARERSILVDDLARTFEKEFFEDMQALEVLPPSSVTRVTEHIPEIVTFVQRLVDTQKAYVSNGSVYFDTVAFGDRYGKLSHGAVREGDVETEGKEEKRHHRDFALWKNATPAELQMQGAHWPSPWGNGRPGWHIECPVMCSHMFGQHLDVHTGGIDLAFPHHENEIAQCEAHHDTEQWVNYFLHTGHLHVEGQKMSKSLKNFTTVQAFLQQHSAQQFRLFALMTKYNAPIHYTEESMQQARHVEQRLINFFQEAQIAIGQGGSNTSCKWTDTDRTLMARLHSIREQVATALADDFNTPLALLKLLELVSDTHSATKRGPLQCGVIAEVRDYVAHMLQIFGVDVGSQVLSVQQGGLSIDANALAGALAHFRHDVRNTVLHAVKEASGQSAFKAILRLCDEIRDKTLPPIGVRLQDREGDPTWQLVDPRAHPMDQSDEPKPHRPRPGKPAPTVPPEELFRNNPEYSRFDEKGIPTHDQDGQELSKNSRKKLAKRWAAHAAAYKKASGVQN
eukprot:comp21843_c3_seq1/m.31198 comp21843_c3_seq1/g.31198  ORF comp21843_c3_seq1/g.31198 comp21843_c3_seq1/m.31198 type:complete len:629 (-) comp21843_c3_seq1:231-2117(-)